MGVEARAPRAAHPLAEPPEPVGLGEDPTFADAPVPAVVVSRGCVPPRVIRANRAFCELAACDHSEAATLPISDVISGLDDALRALDDGRGVNAVSSTLTVAGRELPVMLYATALSDHQAQRPALVQIISLVHSELERALRESEKRVQDVVDNVKALIYIKNAAGAYLLINRYFEEMHGVSRYDAPKRTNFDFFPPEIAEVYTANDQRVLESGIPLEVEEPRMGGGAWLSLKFPLFDVDGDIYGVGGISTDITDRRRAEALIRQAKDEAERANQAKSEFLSRVSHELRTPLNSILGFGQLLQMERLPADTKANVDRIVKAGRHLLALINEVLELSRIEAQPALHNVEPTDICRALTEAVDLVRPLANERGIEIVQDLHGALYESVLADEQRLMQVLLNVLSNAIKYNRVAGTVRIAFRAEGDGNLRLLVSDTGFGIPAQDIGRVFLPFERLGADRTATEGTGLGLTLAHSLIEAMGGTIGIERSVPGEGTTFFVSLPLAPATTTPSARLPLQESQPHGPAIAPGTILYIEDHLANLDLVNGLFARVGNVRLIPAVQGQLGIELAARHQPDLILLDLHLPDLSGDEVLSRLRQDERTALIPVIVLSADATPQQITRLKGLGAVEYVTKPIDVPSFLEAVQRVLGSAPVPGEPFT